MFIHCTTPKSKKRKVPKAQKEQYDAWLKEINGLKTNFSRTKKESSVKVEVVNRDTYVRKTKDIKSLNSSLIDSPVPTKSKPKVYTGTMMKGIATMHKSNAVPVFTDEQAKDISNMRR
jgi:hypothetical protein